MENSVKKRMIDLAAPRLSVVEAADLLRILETAIKEAGKHRTGSGVLEILRNGGYSTAFKLIAVLINQAWRAGNQVTSVIERTSLLKELVYIREKVITTSFVQATAQERDLPKNDDEAEASKPDTPLTLENAIVKVYELNAGRLPVHEEIEIWKNNLDNGLPFHEFLLLMATGPEAKRNSEEKKILNGTGDGYFVQFVYELIHGRGCKAWELNHWTSRLSSRGVRRSDILAEIFDGAVKYFESAAEKVVHDGLSCQIMGTSRFVTIDDWHKKSQELLGQEAPAKDERYSHRFYIKSQPTFLISAIASLYRGGDFIDRFMDNITSQSCFDDYCELIIVDADSPENEYDTIKRYLGRHKTINYIRKNYRVGIYDAWNVGAKVARGDYLTNTNLDDLRRQDSLELQAAALDNLPFVDVVYQDLYYTFDPNLSFGEIAAFGYESNLPIITSYNMMEFNSPHNAPMWRKTLHEELGFFNTHYKSAGDYEFWMRCLTAGKCFYKLNDPHVVYYQNPQGLSTRPDTRGVVEAKEIHHAYGRKLVSENLVMPFGQFCREKLPSVPAELDAGKHDRYAHAQVALRNVARFRKYSHKDGVCR